MILLLSHLKSLSLLVSYTFCGEQFRSWSLPQTKLRIRERERERRDGKGEREKVCPEKSEKTNLGFAEEKRKMQLTNAESRREKGRNWNPWCFSPFSIFFLFKSPSLMFALCSRKNAHQILSHFATQQHFGNQLLAPMNSHPFRFLTSQFLLPLSPSLSLSFSLLLPLKFVWEIFSFCHWTFEPSLLSGRGEGMKEGKGIKERVWSSASSAVAYFCCLFTIRLLFLSVNLPNKLSA